MVAATIEGQLTIWDVLGIKTPEPKVKEKMPPIKAGQIVFLVKAGDVEKFAYTGERLGLGLKNYVIKNYFRKTLFQERDYYKSVFFTRQEANAKAEKYWKEHPAAISKDNIKPLFTYKFVNGADDEVFFFVLEDGYIYVKEQNAFHFMVKFSSIEEAMEVGLTTLKKGYRGYKMVKGKQSNEGHDFKNMYPCKKGCDWAYAEAGFSGVK